METKRKRVIVLGIVCLVILVGAIAANFILKSNDKYFSLISYNNLMKKIDNKEDFVLLISKTDCSHCIDYKPKLSSVAKEYRVVIYYMDVDQLSKTQNEKIKELFNYSGTPTTIFLIDGEEKTSANRIVGDAKTEKIISKLKSNGFIK